MLFHFICQHKHLLASGRGGWHRSADYWHAKCVWPILARFSVGTAPTSWVSCWTIGAELNSYRTYYEVVNNLPTASDKEPTASPGSQVTVQSERGVEVGQGCRPGKIGRNSTWTYRRDFKLYICVFLLGFINILPVFMRRNDSKLSVWFFQKQFPTIVSGHFSLNDEIDI